MLPAFSSVDHLSSEGNLEQRRRWYARSTVLWHVIASGLFFFFSCGERCENPPELGRLFDNQNLLAGKRKAARVRVSVGVFPRLLITTTRRGFLLLLPCTNSAFTPTHPPQKINIHLVPTWESQAAAQTRWTCCAHPLNA